MHISAFFHNLHSAYQAELDDLRQDSEGRNVLRQRLAEKRGELGFLLQMLELSPEMVAVVLHQGFRFTQPALMAHLLAQESDELPPWDSLQDGLEIAPWAQPMVAQILQQSAGPWFMSLVAGLEYLQGTPALLRGTRADQDDEDPDHDNEDDADEAKRDARHDDSHTEDHDEDEADARAREEAGNDWLVAQGFDSKD